MIASGRAGRLDVRIQSYYRVLKRRRSTMPTLRTLRGRSTGNIVRRHEDKCGVLLQLSGYGAPVELGDRLEY